MRYGGSLMDFFFGYTERIRELQSKAERIAGSYLPILIEGEAGVGKERLARHLHEMRGAGGRLVKLLCDLPAAAGFGGFAGEEAGGCLREAGPNTVLLKRANRLPLPIQERILLLLDEIQEPYPFLISTTSDSIERLVASRQFIPELFYRISANRISIPPLRDRREDIPHLFQSMLAEIACHMGATPEMPDSQVLDTLMAYSWPGNLRELQNAARGYLLMPDPAVLQQEIERRQHAMPANPDGWSPSALKEQVKQVSKRAEGEIILRALEHHRWNRRRTAEALRISYRSLMYKMKNCDIRSEVRRSLAQ
jgi:two-component system response regulator AtoC